MGKFNEHEFLPRKSIAERYSLENMAKEKGLTFEEYNFGIGKQLKMRQDMIEEQISKGLIPEQAETYVMRCFYIDGFSGPTFRN